jgi:hypothetical protein
MLQFNTTETILRKADGTCNALKVKVSVYKDPLTMKTVLKRKFAEDVEPTLSITQPDWENNTVLGSREHSWLIPNNKQTDTTPSVRGETRTEYDNLFEDWRTMYLEDADFTRMQQELLTEFEADDGHYES